MNDLNLTIFRNIGFSSAKRWLGVVILFSLVFISCDNQTIIHPTHDNPVVEFQEEDIHIEFYLMDRDLQPVLQMSENENFVLCFAIRNRQDQTISISPDFLNENFFRIYTARNNMDQGVPYTGMWCDQKEDEQVLKIAPGETKMIRCPWFFIQDMPTDFPLCGGDNRTPYLPPGDYYTTVDLAFEYTINEEIREVSDKQMRINFEVF